MPDLGHHLLADAVAREKEKSMSHFLRAAPITLKIEALLKARLPTRKRHGPGRARRSKNLSDLGTCRRAGEPASPGRYRSG
jgi:hypothetical protein